MDLETNEALLRWMEDEGLSPFALLKISPKPTAKTKRPPASVVMEWGLEDLAHEGARERFLAWTVTAEQVDLFRCDGVLDRFEECHAEVGEGPGVELRLDNGGRLLLRCKRLVVGEPVERFRKGRPRPHHGEVHLELDLSAATLGDLRQWLDLPRALSAQRQLTAQAVSDDSKLTKGDNLTLVDAAGQHHVWLSVGTNRFTVARGKWAPDEVWTNIWTKLRCIPGVTVISSRDLVTTAAAWPESPPPKPVPQVWPNVFQATCDFTHLTLDGLRECLELPSSCKFVFEAEELQEAHPQLKLGDAARHAGRTAVSCVFQHDGAQPLVRCRADVREGFLSFQRERACDDVTWQTLWSAAERLPNLSARRSRTTCSPPDPWPTHPPTR